MFSIQPLAHTHINSVISLLSEAFSERYRGSADMSILEDENSSLWMAIDENHVVGYAALYILKKPSRKLGVIEDVAVDKNHRGRGIGLTLVKRLIEIAKINNCDKVMLSTTKENFPYYEKVGFESGEFQMIIRL